MEIKFTMTEKEYKLNFTDPIPLLFGSDKVIGFVKKVNQIDSENYEITADLQNVVCIWGGTNIKPSKVVDVKDIRFEYRKG